MKRYARWATATTIIGTGLLVFGNYRDPWLWAYIAAFGIVGLYAMAGMDEDLVRERFRPRSAGADRLSLRAVRLVALGHLLLGIADSRFRWTHVVPPLRALGLVGFCLCFVMIARAARANRFFSTVVRIQSERGHRLVDTGPYATVRHPGYAAMLPLVQFSALALGSWIAFAAAFAYSALIFRRVRFEDKYLQQHLDGYSAYTTRVPYRLIPRVW